MGRAIALALVAAAACGGGDPGGGPGGDPPEPGDPLGDDHDGQYHLGPVDWEETQWHNACAPYPESIRDMTGELIAGVSGDVAAPGSLCDACIEVTTARGHTAVLRVVTYGVEAEPGDIDVSPAAFDLLTEDEFPRTMTWHLVECDNGQPLYLQFKDEASQYWTSLWVRNPSQPIAGVDVISANHDQTYSLQLGTDGTYTDPGGFGAGAFTLRVHGMAGDSVEVELPGVPGGDLVAAPGNF